MELCIEKSCIKTISSWTFSKSQLPTCLPRILPYKVLHLGLSWRIDLEIASSINNSLSSPKCCQFWEKGGMEFFTCTSQSYSGVEMGPLFDPIHWFKLIFLPLFMWVLAGNWDSWNKPWNFVSKRKAKLSFEVSHLGCEGFSGVCGPPDFPLTVDQAPLPGVHGHQNLSLAKMSNPSPHTSWWPIGQSLLLSLLTLLPSCLPPAHILRLACPFV